jgi:hypothetical protein
MIRPVNNTGLLRKRLGSGDAGVRGQRFDLNDIACIRDIPNEDYEQFAQLHGYSLSGAGDLSCFTDATYEAAYEMYTGGLTEEQAKIKYLEEQLAEVRRLVKQLAPVLFRIHEDDLVE